MSQIAAEAAYTNGWPYFEEFLRHLTRIRDYASERLNAMPGITCKVPAGTFLLFPNVSAYGLESTAMAEYLLAEARVAIVPGATRWFGAGAEGHIRIAFATSQAIVSEALDRIERALAKLPTPTTR